MNNQELSDRHLAANRANALKSTGPNTPEGKAASSLNALTHGITAQTPVLSHENPAEYAALRLEYYDRFLPLDPFEDDLLDDIIKVRWHIRRIREIEDAHFEIELSRPDIRQGFDQIGGAALTAICHSRLNGSGALALANKQLSRLSREYNRLIRTFVDLRRDLPPHSSEPTARPDNGLAGQNEPNPISEHSEPHEPAEGPVPPPIAAIIRHTTPAQLLILAAGASLQSGPNPSPVVTPPLPPASLATRHAPLATASAATSSTKARPFSRRF